MTYGGNLLNWTIQARKNSWIPRYNVGKWDGRVQIVWVTDGDEAIFEYLDTIGL
jgi:hypothetical protein